MKHRSFPSPDYTGQKLTLTIGEFREAPGRAIDFVSYGGEILITKNGKPVICLVQPDTEVFADGTWTGSRPLMMGVKV